MQTIRIVRLAPGLALLLALGCGGGSSGSASETGASSTTETSTTGGEGAQPDSSSSSSEPTLPEEGCPANMPAGGSGCTTPDQTCHYYSYNGNEHSGRVTSVLGCSCSGGTWACDSPPMI
ncbi:MAG: hypothetical protein U0234_11055 [Sandaracinus sp.]